MSVEISVIKRLGTERGSEFELDISFSLKNGITILGGDSGAGKTTTLRLIAGILTPDSGAIKVGETTYFDSTQNVNLSIQRRNVGFVFQDYALFPHLNAEQNIAYGVKAEGKSARSRKALEMLRLFNIEHIKARHPRDISGGEQQRVALARALASNPDIVLLDEPLSAVDVETRAKLITEIEAAQRQTNIPFIYVTHNQAEITRLGSQQVYLRNGRVV